MAYSVKMALCNKLCNAGLLGNENYLINLVKSIKLKTHQEMA